MEKEEEKTGMKKIIFLISVMLILALMLTGCFGIYR